MNQALEMIDRWCRYVLVRQFTESHGWELQNMLTVARLIVRSALAREESAACTSARISARWTTNGGIGTCTCVLATLAVDSDRLFCGVRFRPRHPR